MRLTLVTLVLFFWWCFFCFLEGLLGIQVAYVYTVLSIKNCFLNAPEEFGELGDIFLRIFGYSYVCFILFPGHWVIAKCLA